MGRSVRHFAGRIEISKPLQPGSQDAGVEGAPYGGLQERQGPHMTQTAAMLRGVLMRVKGGEHGRFRGKKEADERQDQNNPPGH